MKTHTFLFGPYEWVGQGKIQISMIDEELDFHTSWRLGQVGFKSPPGEVISHLFATQEVQIENMDEAMRNQFVITELTPSHFKIELENGAIGKMVGKGIIKEDLIAWEFRNPEIGFEGFEFYQRQEDGTYLMGAEYATSGDAQRTVIRGKIWQKGS